MASAFGPEGTMGCGPAVPGPVGQGASTAVGLMRGRLFRDACPTDNGRDTCSPVLLCSSPRQGRRQEKAA